MKGQTRAWTRAAARCGFAALCAVLAGRAAAAVIKVPVDQPTIQAAINVAVPGDVVQVRQGTYKENVVLKPKVRLEGGWDANYNARNWNAWPSVIDGDQKGSVVVGADRATLDGFTLRNGMAEWGGGLRLVKGQMTIRNNDIQDNTATSGGGGISIDDHPLAPPFTDVEGNVIRRNKVTTDRGGTGGGIHVTRSRIGIRITGNTIGGGAADGNDARWGGGGIYVEQTPVIQIEKNKITHNLVEKGHGGGVLIVDGSPNATLAENEIKYNLVQSGNYGGGVYSVGGTYIHRNAIAGNTVQNVLACGGGIAVEAGPGTPPSLENNFVYGNEAEKGAGLCVLRGSDILVTNDSVAGNKPDKPNAGAGLYVRSGATCWLQNTILWGNGDDFREEVAGACRLFNNDIEHGGAPGQDGNIQADPLFKAGDDLHVGKASPVIDAGLASVAPKKDFDGQTRDAKPDIGADEVVKEGGKPCTRGGTAMIVWLSAVAAALAGRRPRVGGGR